MKINKIIIACIVLFAVTLIGCTVKYSLSGASIPANARTVSIAYFPNNATIVAPTLSSDLTQGLQDKFQRQTKLELVPEDGDLAFEGEITYYTVSPAAVSSNDVAAVNRLQVTVKVRFVNRIDPQWNYDKSFSAFQDYPATQDLSTAESSLIPELVKTLVEDIFNAAVAQW